jgi:glutamyl-tRNA reductase
MIGVIGVSHKSASVKVREKFALDSDDADLLARRLLGNDYFRELVVLSTCNRTEIYFAA